MAYTTSFDGAADTLLSSFPGWAPTSGYYDVLSLNGSGALKNAAYTDDPKNLLNNTSSASHYVKVVVGSGFVASTGFVGIMFCATSRSDAMALRYDAGTSLYLSKDGGGPAESLAGQTVVAGDELEVRWDAITQFVVVKKNGTTIYNADISYHAGGKTGTSVGVWLNYSGSPSRDDIFRSWESDAIGAIDTDAPTLSAVSATVTGATTASGNVTTTESGPAWAVMTTGATTPTAAQIKAGQNASGETTPAATANLISGPNPSAFLFTGLSPATGYYLHVVQDDTAVPANTATPVTAAIVTTDTPDVVGPTLSAGSAVVKSNALIALSTTTNEPNGTLYAVLTTSSTAPSAAQIIAGQNNLGTAAVWFGNQAIGSVGVKTFNATGLLAATGYHSYLVHRDSSGNDSAVQALGQNTTFRNGATGQWIIDHPGSFLFQCIEAGDEDAWFDWEQVTPPATGSWVEGPYADGTGVFEGPNATSMVILLRKNGVSVGNFTVFLYDTTVSASQGGGWSVRNLIASAQAGAWSARNTAAATQAGAWSARNLIGSTQAGAWSVVNLVSVTQSGAWSIQADGFANAAQPGAWSVRNLASASQPGAWSVLSRVETTQVGAWSVFGGVSATQAGAWSVSNNVATAQSGAWSVRMMASANQPGAWAVQGIVIASATQSGAWTVLNLVEATQALAWSVRNITRVPSSGLRVVIIDADGAGILGSFSMQPGEVLDFGFDFQPWLNDCNDTIASYAVTSTDDMPIMETDRIEGVIVALVDGTVDGASHKLTCSIQTNGGRVKEADIRVRVKEF